ncbi:short-chain dehydrogenase/reductase [Roseateles aquatilis]|uniref:Short-chain dehydrogenase/reductase n=1 Tax=Roseateles aquatilis TaxID=431061 RepID=A0A246IUA6_9BURK|nr:oxidoreductase [Roseateles aquatilis]OWQ83776.1 short-chain dehydrogenase/reductase [Roseateles aquatilis]
MKTALVTGASSGIGEATARQLVSDGYKVFAAARRLDRMKSLEALGVTLVPLDLTNDASIVAAVAEVERAAGGRLDVLVNNAGYGSYGSLEDVPMDEARRQIEVNLMGLARLSQLVIPLMRAQTSGTIVNITSVGGKLGEPFGSWYHATKFAVEGLSDCMRMELKPFGIRVVVIEPGAIRTEWNEIARDSLIARSGATPYGPYAQRHAAMLGSANASSMASQPDIVARTIGKAVAARNPRPRYATGGGAKTIVFLTWLLPDRLLDRLLWRMSQSMG